MFLFVLILALAILLTSLNGLETSCGQSNHDDRMFNKLVDIECILKQVETVLNKFFSVDISWKKKPTICASTTSTTTTLPTITSPATPPPPKCPENWISFQQSCNLFSENLLDVNGAAEKCKSLNSHMVYVDNLKEFLYLRDYVMSYGTGTIKNRFFHEETT